MKKSAYLIINRQQYCNRSITRKRTNKENGEYEYLGVMDFWRYCRKTRLDKAPNRTIRLYNC